VAGSRGKVVVAMSGGVDSSVAACLLHEQGYEVIGLFMRTGVEEPGGDGAGRPVRGCCGAQDAADARSVAGRLGVPFFALNFREAFEELIEQFVAEYRRGRTPNPCVLCNERLKFGRLADYARAAGADFIATGHYARVLPAEDGPGLFRGVDRAKDQSYVLFGIGRETLARTLLPLGGMTKAEVRACARRFGLTLSAKPESQDICFVPDGDYAGLVRRRCPEAFAEGPVLDVQGRRIGRHAGLPNYTIGQRRGLGLALGEPCYVVAIDPARNALTVGPRSALAGTRLTASGMRWLIPPPTEPFRALAQIRYAHQASPAVVEPLGPDGARVAFDQPQAAITPGQAVVLYRQDMVLGGGWIESSEPRDGPFGGSGAVDAAGGAH